MLPCDECLLPPARIAFASPRPLPQMSASVAEATQKAAQDTAAVEERLAEVKRALEEERRKVGWGWLGQGSRNLERWVGAGAACVAVAGAATDCFCGYSC